MHKQKTIYIQQALFMAFMRYDEIQNIKLNKNKI